MTDDPIATFYEQHPYPPPVADLNRYVGNWGDGRRQRVEHHRMWPTEPLREDPSILVAGCGTSQAAKYALRYPKSRVVGIDVSARSIEESRRLANAHGLDQLELHQLGIERSGELDTLFDLVVCTGVLHHLADPDAALRALRDRLAPGGVIQLMVYAPYGRSGVYLLQDYCRLLGLDTSAGDIGELISVLHELPVGHPLGHLLRSTPDFRHDDALADALLNPRDRSFSVPELFSWIRGAGLEFGRWVRQAPYLPTCGSMSELAHGARIAQLDIEEQYAALELFRGTMTRHSFLAHRSDDDPGRTIGADQVANSGWVPVRPTTVISVTERLPPGASAALLNQAHEFPDLVMFVDDAEHAWFDAIDGRRTIGDIAPAATKFFRRLYDHDLVVFDASRTGAS